MEPASGATWIPHAWAVGSLASAALFGGPGMLKQAALARELGAPRSANVLSALAWLSMGMTPPIALALFMGWP